MRAMVATAPGAPLQLQQREVPVAGRNEVLLRVIACGVCRTDLHVVDGELDFTRYPVVPGHQIIGSIERLGEGVAHFKHKQIVGVPWLGGSCGSCAFCQQGKENLCDDAVYTGCHIDGGFAEYAVARADYCFSLPERYPGTQAAPLLCAGLIGYRAYRMAADAQHLGLYGFGAAAHILLQVANYHGKQVYAFTRENDIAAQQFARRLGAQWSGSSQQYPGQLLDAAIIFAAAGALVPAALRAVKKGGKVICAGIHMSDIPAFPYALLWGERSIASVANLTRRDGEEFLPLAAQIPVATTVREYTLEQANEALNALRVGQLVGAAVIVL